MGLLALAILINASALARPPVASAHPLGNFTINRYSRIEPGVDQIRLRYVLDLAEIPTFQEMPKIDSDRDGKVSETENTTYLGDKAEQLKSGLQLSVNGNAVLLDAVTQELNPHFSLLQSDIARQTLAELAGPAATFSPQGVNR